jgi:hypothetical protein
MGQAEQPVAQISFCGLVPSLNHGFIDFTARIAQRPLRLSLEAL